MEKKMGKKLSLSHMLDKGYVMITGAGSCIGKSLALKFAKRNYRIVLIGRTKGKLILVQKDIGENSTLVIETDVSKKESVDRAFNKANAWGKRPYIVISCAGEGVFGKIGSFSQADVERVMAGNLLGTIFVSQRAFLEMKEIGGYIVNIMSSSANKGDPIQSIYCASKWGAKGFNESLKLEAKNTPVKVLGVYPGCVRTPFWDKYKWLHPDTTGFMNPDEVASTVIDSILNKHTLWVADIAMNRFYQNENAKLRAWGKIMDGKHSQTKDNLIL
jgi:short-subunit dehydrogenase